MEDRRSPSSILYPQSSLLVTRVLSAFAPLREIIRLGCGCVALLFVAAGCDPVVNIGGTFFPGWMVAILIGSALTVAIRYVFVFTRLERHVGPLALIYASLGVLLSVVSWLILYRS
jgi:YtcA family